MAMNNRNLVDVFRDYDPIATEGLMSTIAVKIRNIIDKILMALQNLISNLLKIRKIKAPKEIIDTGLKLLNATQRYRKADFMNDDPERIESVLTKLQGSDTYIDFSSSEPDDYDEEEYVEIPKETKILFVNALKQDQSTLAKLRSNIRDFENKGLDDQQLIAELLKDFYTYELSIVRKVLFFNKPSKQVQDDTIHLDVDAELRF